MIIRLALVLAIADSIASAQQGDLYAISVSSRWLHRVTLEPFGSVPVAQVTPANLPADLAGLVAAGDGLAYCIERNANLLLTLRLQDAEVLASVPLDQDVMVNQRGFDVAPNGVLWGVLPGLQLRTIDPASGQTTLVAQITGARIIEAIAFSPTGTLYAAGDPTSSFRSRRLYTLDTITGEASPIADLPVPDVDALTWAPDGYLYGADSGGFSADLYQIDPATGALRVVGDTGITGLNGLVALPDRCYADCDGNTTLDIFDFLCFQNAFVAMDPYADCDGSTTLDIFDFLCFQDAFVTGCQ